MSESAPAVPQAGTLQFDTAEPAAPRACVLCKQPVASVYHLANGKTICSPCRVNLEAHRAGSGSRFLRFGKAMTFGLGAAVAGWLIYYAILKITKLEIGFVAILVGYMVGRSMYIGSGRRGGRAYQVMAVVLTYFAMAFTYVPLLMETMAKEAGDTPAVILISSLLAATVMPFLTIAESPFGIVILGIGVYQAWKTAARAQIAITGPHQVPQPAPLAAPAAVPAFE